MPLKVAQFPGFRDLFDARRPGGDPGNSRRPSSARCRNPAWCRSGPAWSPAPRRAGACWCGRRRTLPRSGAYEPFEGIIETDRWFGPLITNLRLTKTDVPIDFRADFPLLQVQPLPRDAYDEPR